MSTYSKDIHMWHLIQYPANFRSNPGKFGVIEASNFDLPDTAVCRDSNGAFAVSSLSKLTKVTKESDRESWTFNEWLNNTQSTILLSFESDDPLTDLPNLFPEYYL